MTTGRGRPRHDPTCRKMAMSFVLAPDTSRKLDALAATLALSRSSVVARAIDALAITTLPAGIAMPSGHQAMSADEFIAAEAALYDEDKA